ncbi:MAG TPA: alpha/beta hydrolase [Kofleriaceae bacterium]|nr:alpha/beta hydrolase [Kofleriaceae bacterium]
MPAWTPHAVKVAPDGAEPRGWLLFLHGILGSGSNWRTIARRLTAARPEWGAVLVDLRMHGKSQEAPPPHTIDAAAGDLVRLAGTLAVPIGGAIGHSFGGKVALALRGKLDLAELWVLDATPGARPEPRGDPDSAQHVLDALRRLPAMFADRPAFVAALTGAGFSRALADWLAMNLDPADGGYRLRLDLDAVGELLADYYRRDLWSALESGAGNAHLVIATRSRALDDDDRRRAASLPVAVHPIAAGHWLHMEAPDQLLALLSAELSAPPRA